MTDYKQKYLYYKNKYINLKKNKMIYKKTGEIVEIIQTHYDDITPYYTIKMMNGRELQTVADRLKKI